MTSPVTPPVEDLARFFQDLCANDDLSRRLPARSDPDDPLAELVKGVNGFLDKMWLREFQLAARQEMLEKVVEIRTNEVHEILDNVKAGFLVVDEDQVVQDNYSRSCNAIFDRSDIHGERLVTLMALDERDANNFSAMFEQLFAGFLPLDVATAQLPRSFSLGERHYTIEGEPLVIDDEVRRVFFTISDATDLRRAETENALRRSLIEIIKQRDSFLQFLEDFRRMVQSAAKTNDARQIRADLHTTKGNLGCFGLHELAELVHSLEELQSFEYGQMLTVEQALRTFLAANHDVLQVEYDSANVPLTVDVERVSGALEEIVEEQSRFGRQELARALITKARWLPVGRVLPGLRSLVERVAARGGKDVRVEFVNPETLIDPRWAGETLSTLIHLVRNSIDHGIEPIADRGDKPAQGTIRVSCEDVGDRWVVKVEDDGRGIDVDAVVEAAIEKGFRTREQVSRLDDAGKLALVFVDRLTTRREASMSSGRGVGMGAVRSAVEWVGGEVTAVSTPGRGTSITVTIPYPPVGAASQGAQSFIDESPASDPASAQ